MSAHRQVLQKNRRLVVALVALTVGMFGFGYALVPLYKVVCQAFGINGKTGRVSASIAEVSQVDTSRWVTVQFTGQSMAGLPWEFRSLTQPIRLHPGQTGSARFLARNLSAQTITGQAVPSVAPQEAATHFKKIECFCFSRQRLEGGQSEEMPVVFLLEHNLPKDVNTVTLSYAFFNVEQSPAQPRSAQTAADRRQRSVIRAAVFEGPS